MSVTQRACLLFLLVLQPYNALAGFDIGMVGNSLFWVGLALWSALIAWFIYTHRASLGRKIFSILKFAFAPHTKRAIVVSAPKYRPYVETTHVVDALAHRAETFLSSAKSGVHSAGHATRDALSILERDADSAISAAQRQMKRIRGTTTLADRVHNMKRMLMKQPKKGVVQQVSTHDDAHHTRKKVQVLADAHRALIRAKNAQHDLPQVGAYAQEGHTPLIPTSTEDVPKENVWVQAVAPSVPKKDVHAPQPAPQQTQKVVEKTQSAPEHVVSPVQPAHPVKSHEIVDRSTQTSATKDELVLDTSGPVPRLVLTRKRV